MSPHSKLSLADRLISSPTKPELTKSARLLSRSLLALLLGSIAFLAVDIYLGLELIQWICVSQIIGAGFYIWLIRKGHLWLAGLLGHVHVIIDIFLIAAVFSSACMIHTLLIPTLVSLIAVFGSARKKTAVTLLVLCMVTLALLEFLEFRISPIDLPHHTLDVTKTVNFVGAMLLTFYVIYFVTKVSESSQAMLEDKRLELQDKNAILSSAMAARDKLVSTISHDIRGPLNNIYASLNLLNSGKISPEDWKMLSQKIQVQTKDALDFIETTMKWISAQSDQLKAHMVDYGTKQITAGVTALAAPVAESKNIRLDVNIEPNAIAIADEHMINSVLRNLVSNAIKFTGELGVVKLVVVKAATKVRYSVIDSGRGMTTEQLEKVKAGMIFSTPGTENERGHGMGLVLSKQFLKLHGAHLTIQSSESSGTTMSFELPLAQPTVVA